MMAGELVKAHIAALAYHAGLKDDERSMVQQRWVLEDRCKVHLHVHVHVHVTTTLLCILSKPHTNGLPLNQFGKHFSFIHTQSAKH